MVIVIIGTYFIPIACYKINNHSVYFTVQTWFYNNPQPAEAHAAGHEEQYHGPDGWDAGKVQQQSRGPGGRENTAGTDNAYNNSMIKTYVLLGHLGNS